MVDEFFRLSIQRVRRNDERSFSSFSTPQIDARKLIFTLRQLLAAFGLLTGLASGPDPFPQQRPQLVMELGRFAKGKPSAVTSSVESCTGTS